MWKKSKVYASEIGPTRFGSYNAGGAAEAEVVEGFPLNPFGLKLSVCFDVRRLTRRQSYKRNFVVKKSKLVLNLLTVRYVI